MRRNSTVELALFRLLQMNLDDLSPILQKIESYFCGIRRRNEAQLRSTIWNLPDDMLIYDREQIHTSVMEIPPLDSLFNDGARTQRLFPWLVFSYQGFPLLAHVQIERSIYSSGLIMYELKHRFLSPRCNHCSSDRDVISVPQIGWMRFVETPLTEWKDLCVDCRKGTTPNDRETHFAAR